MLDYNISPEKIATIPFGANLDTDEIKINERKINKNYEKKNYEKKSYEKKEMKRNANE